MSCWSEAEAESELAALFLQCISAGSKVLEVGGVPDAESESTSQIFQYCEASGITAMIASELEVPRESVLCCGGHPRRAVQGPASLAPPLTVGPPSPPEPTSSSSL